MENQASSASVNEQLFRAMKEGNLEEILALIYAVNPDDLPIHLATRFGHRDVVEYFLNNGCHVDKPDTYKYTPLHIASRHGHLEMVKLLLTRFADVHARNKRNEKPIHMAVEHGHKHVVEVLLDYGNDVDEIDEDDCTLLGYAVKQNRLYVAKLLLDKGANVDASLSWNHTLLSWAAHSGHSEIVQLLVDTGADVHAANLSGYKPIHIAVSHSHIKIVEILLSNGSGVDEIDIFGYTPLHCVTMETHLEVARFLLDKGANVHARVLVGNGNSRATQKAIHVAAECGYTGIVELLLNYGNDVDEIDEAGFRPLHFAMECGCLDLVQLLISKHADIHAKTIRGEKPIHLAAEHGHGEIVELFLNMGVKVNDIDNFGSSLLHFALGRGYLGVVQLLIKYTNKNADTDSAPSAQTSQDGTIMAEDAPSRGSVIDAQDKEGSTPLHLAFQRYEVEIVQCLLEAGARSDIKDKYGNTAIIYFLRVLPDFDRSFLLVPEILQKMHFFDIDGKNSSVAHNIIKRHDLNIEQVNLVLQYQKDLNVKDITGWTPLNYLTEPHHPASINERSELIRLVINHGAYFSALDCRNIIDNSFLKKNLFTDVELCTQSVVNKFNNKDLPTMYKIISSESELPPLDKMKVKSGQVRTIELALEQQINDEGYCNVSRRMPVTLAILCVRAYISHHQRM